MDESEHARESTAMRSDEISWKRERFVPTKDDELFTLRFADGENLCLKQCFARALFGLVRNLEADCAEQINTLEIPFSLMDYEEMISAIYQKQQNARSPREKIYQICNFLQVEIDLFDDGPTMTQLAEKGNLLLLKWARANGSPWCCDTIVPIAASNGHLEILQWALANSRDGWGPYTCAYAAEGGHLEILKWLHENGCPWDWTTCTFAARNGRLEILKWARANGCPWNAWACLYATQRGHLETLKWLRANGCPWEPNVCVYAAESGHLPILKWARANGCPWGGMTCGWAAKCGHPEVLEWARANGCPE